MKRKSDLSPPLGFPGGPCYVADRARGLSNFRRIQEELERKGELSSALEKKVYPRRHLQKGKGKANLFLSSHAQYRMDLRSITVPLLQRAFVSFEEWFLKIVSNRRSGSPEDARKFNQLLEKLKGSGFTWLDPSTKLEFGIKYDRSLPSNAFLISTVYLKGERDPKAPGRGSCDQIFTDLFRNHPPREEESDPLLNLLTRRAIEAAYRKLVNEQTGIRTFVDEKADKGISDPNQPSSYVPYESPEFDGYRNLSLPSGHPKSREKRIQQPAYNTPGDGSSYEGYIPAVPGDQYGHPYIDQGTTLHKRRAIIAGSQRVASRWVTGASVPPSVQKAISPSVLRDLITKRLKGEKLASRFLQRKSGLMKMFPPPSERQKKQRGAAKVYYKQYYQKNRAKINRQNKARYRLKKNQFRFKRDREMRRDPAHERKFERKPGGGAFSIAERSRAYREEKREKVAEVLTPQGIYFMIPGIGEGEVYGISDFSDTVTVYLDSTRFGTGLVSFPLDLFLEDALFDEESFELISALLGATYKMSKQSFYYHQYSSADLPAEDAEDGGLPSAYSPVLRYPDFDENHPATKMNNIRTVEQDGGPRNVPSIKLVRDRYAAKTGKT